MKDSAWAARDKHYLFAYHVLNDGTVLDLLDPNDHARWQREMAAALVQRPMLRGLEPEREP